MSRKCAENNIDKSSLAIAYILSAIMTKLYACFKQKLRLRRLRKNTAKERSKKQQTAIQEAVVLARNICLAMICLAVICLVMAVNAGR